ncbi:MAG TPA: type IV pili twitching motility protein PilT, partial [Epsilonproteobacteria bacterium]|nr:type IV pili twitching motility protein PilT [Campylobacterota bacterium]
MEKRLTAYLQSLKANKGSDLHRKAGATVRVRINGSLRILGNERVSAEEVLQ